MCCPVILNAKYICSYENIVGSVFTVLTFHESQCDVIGDLYLLKYHFHYLIWAGNVAVYISSLHRHIQYIPPMCVTPEHVVYLQNVLWLTAALHFYHLHMFQSASSLTVVKSSWMHLFLTALWGTPWLHRRLASCRPALPFLLKPRAGCSPSSCTLSF